MVSNVDPVNASVIINQASAVNFSGSAGEATAAHERSASDDKPVEASKVELTDAAAEISKIVNEVASTSLSFSIEEDLSRMVVAVRSVGSDKIIRQFPPEEFLTVAKFIAAQNPDELDEDFLKGILFDQYT